MIIVSVLSLNPTPTQSAIKYDRLCLAQNIYHEARNQSIAGQKAVASVVFNRVNNKRYPDKICDVVFQGKFNIKANQFVKDKCQFSWVCIGKKLPIKEKKKFKEIYNRSQRLIQQFKNNQFVDITNGATHYHHISIKPYWAKKFIHKVTIGKHKFYKEKK